MERCDIIAVHVSISIKAGQGTIRIVLRNIGTGQTDLKSPEIFLVHISVPVKVCRCQIITIGGKDRAADAGIMKHVNEANVLSSQLDQQSRRYAVIELRIEDEMLAEVVMFRAIGLGVIAVENYWLAGVA